MKKRTGYQQGDVLIIAIEQPSCVGKRQEPQGGQHALVYGEHTGNVHAVPGEGVEVFVTEEGRRYLHALREIPLTHGNGSQTGHVARTILPGWYEIEQVQEIDPFTGEIDAVRD